MMSYTDEQLESAIDAQPFEKVTKDSINLKIKSADYMILPNSTVTICNLILENGFSVRGESACVHSDNFNKKIGEEIAYRDAFSKIWQLEGYLLAQKRYENGL